MSRTALLCLVAACGGSSATALPPTDPATLMTTLTDLAAFGNKHAGTAEGDRSVKDAVASGLGALIDEHRKAGRKTVIVSKNHAHSKPVALENPQALIVWSTLIPSKYRLAHVQRPMSPALLADITQPWGR